MAAEVLVSRLVLTLRIQCSKEEICHVAALDHYCGPKLGIIRSTLSKNMGLRDSDNLVRTLTWLLC